MRTSIVSYASRKEERELREKRTENRLFWRFIAGMVSAMTVVALTTICYEADLLPQWAVWPLGAHACYMAYVPTKRLLRFFEKTGR